MDDLLDRTQKLAADANKKDRRFRNAKAVFYTLLGLAVGALLLSSYSQQAANHKLLDTLAGYADQRTHQIQDLQNHIDCIATFLGQKHRENLTITDLSNCGLKRADNGQLEVITPPVGSSLPQPTAPVPKAKASGSTHVDNGPGNNTPPAPPVDNPKPIQILGLQVCVPLTHICVTR